MIHKLDRLPPYSLADGFSLRMYQPGDEAIWLEICKYGLLAESDGMESWDTCMLSMENLVPERDVFFICNAEGQAVATCTSFVKADNVALLHMLAAKPEARGHKLAYSMTAYALHKLDREMSQENRMVRLKSDDWRVSAVRTYLQCGFQPVIFDVDMDTRWKAICDKLDIHGIEMLDDDGNPTGVIL